MSLVGNVQFQLGGLSFATIIKKNMTTTPDETTPNVNEESTLQPEPETLNTPDPQKKMDGPVSSAIKNIGEIFNTDEERDEDDEK